MCECVVPIIIGTQRHQDAKVASRHCDFVVSIHTPAPMPQPQTWNVMLTFEPIQK